VGEGDGRDTWRCPPIGERNGEGEGSHSGDVVWTAHKDKTTDHLDKPVGTFKSFSLVNGMNDPKAFFYIKRKKKSNPVTYHCPANLFLANCPAYS
jgi:hypothetical protein